MDFMFWFLLLFGGGSVLEAVAHRIKHGGSANIDKLLNDPEKIELLIQKLDQKKAEQNDHDRLLEEAAEKLLDNEFAGRVVDKKLSK